MPPDSQPLSDRSVCRAPDCTCARHPDPTCAEILRLRAENERLRSLLADDAHHHAATVAGLLRLWGRNQDDEGLRECGDRLAGLCGRIRSELSGSFDETNAPKET